MECNRTDFIISWSIRTLPIFERVVDQAWTFQNQSNLTSEQET